MSPSCFSPTLSSLHTQFTVFARQIIAVYQVNAEKIVDIVDNFGVGMTAYAVGANRTWPFVTMPAFEAQAARTMEQSGARTVAIAHLVPGDLREAWIEYAQENIGWKKESYEYYGIMNNTGNPAPPFIWGPWNNYGPVDGLYENYSYYAPIWQAAPIPSSDTITNYDAFR